MAFALKGGAAASSAVAAGGSAQARVPSGDAAFARVCQPCHGVQGRNGIAPPLVPMTRNTNEVLGIVREGIGQMPAISPRALGDDEVGQIVAYLRSLARP